MPEVRIYSKKQKIPKDLYVIDLDEEYPELNPINIGPTNLYKGRISNNLHNAWEYSKVYKECTESGQPTQKYWEWAVKGWNSDKPAKTSRKKYLYHFWDGAKYGMIEARKHIFAPLYIKSIHDHPKYYELYNLIRSSDMPVALIANNSLDYKKMSFTEALFNPDKEFDYSFLLAMMIIRDNGLTDIP